MHLKSFKNIKKYLFIPLLLCIVAGMPKYSIAQEQKEIDEEQVKILRKRFKSKSTIEKIVSFPGKVVFIPIDFTLSGVKQGIKIYDESKIGPKVKDFLTSDDGLRGVTPTYASRTGAGINFYQKDLINPGSKLKITLTAGPKKSKNVQMKFSRIKIYGNLQGDLDMYSQFIANEHFYGMGPTSLKENESGYGHEKTCFNGAIGLALHENLLTNFRLGYERNKIKSGSDDDSPSLTDTIARPAAFGSIIPGLCETVDFNFIKTEIEYDSKNRQGNPTSGTELFLNGSIFKQTNGSEFGFTKYSADVKQYIHLFYNRVLVLRAAFEVTQNLSDRTIPFYYLAELGNDDSIRGFLRGRFHDRDFILGSAEYRFPLTRHIDALVFTDAGKVSERLSTHLNTDDLQITYGTGIRIYTDSSLITRLEIGRSDDGFRLLFKLN